VIWFVLVETWVPEISKNPSNPVVSIFDNSVNKQVQAWAAAAASPKSGIF
jgi:hypothetical protein